MPGKGRGERTEPRPSPRNKRAEIVAVATECFGEDGYEDTKWADVAKAVGLGPTALYHYFESKQHCLFEILVEALEDALAEFERLNQGEFAVAFPAVVRGSFDRDDREVRRARVLVAEQGLVRHPRQAPREENARLRAFALLKQYMAGWRDLLAVGMREGTIPAAEPELLARVVIGSYNSVWQWYRPEGPLEIDAVADFYVPRLLALAGMPE
ncbi:MAG TPA: TetR/AcrR family transcriptional regulator [Solirubrobacterales bacterium]|jgi:AcrR family transcriptional regulator|nr:TetR/AcrR family transcriptional regulator [Solirubrobacterales bacterium]